MIKKLLSLYLSIFLAFPAIALAEETASVTVAPSARIKKGRLGLDEYLRVSRAGSNFGLDRKMRMAIWAHYASKNWRRARMSSQKTASMIRMDGTYI